MPNRGKPNATGRSSGKLNGRFRKMLGPPEGEPWVWLTAEMLASDAWRSLSVNARRLLEFLMIEHTNHGGAENGALKAPYEQLERFGMSANLIASAIREVELHGLVACERHGMRIVSTYRLTWLPDRDGNPPTNNWRQFKNQKSAPKTKGTKPPKVRAEGIKLPSDLKADRTPKNEVPIYILEGKGDI